MPILNKASKVKFWLSLYVFIFVFDPPFLPLDPIYLIGLITFFYVCLHSNQYKWPTDLDHYKNFIVHLFIYFLLIITLNFFVNTSDSLLLNSLRCINASFILTLIELFCVLFVIKTSERKGLGLNDIYDILLWAGILQSLFALIAFVLPGVREIFLTFAKGDMYSNEYFLERRGYGFAMNLVDTYGYAIGLIAGCMLIAGRLTRLKKIIFLILLIFCTFVNSRTGLAIIIIGIVFSVFKVRSSTILVKRLFWGGIIGCFVFFIILPLLFDYALNSQQETLKWVASDFNKIYTLLIGNQINEPIDFISTRVGPPQEFFQFFFGSGHSVYGTKRVLGFATDIGYINLWWMYGIVGMSVLFLQLIILFTKAFRYAVRSEEKVIIFFLAITYFMMLEKANLLGYNPGTCVVYLLLFSILYFKHIKRYG